MNMYIPPPQQDLVKQKTCINVFSGSVRWASKERQIFRQNFRTKGKEFNEIKKDVSVMLL